MNVESRKFIPDEEYEREEKQQAWLQLHLWMSHRLQREREQLASGEYLQPDVVLGALQQYRDLPLSEGWKNITREQVEPDFLAFFEDLRSQGRAGAIAATRTDQGSIEEIHLLESQVIRNIALLQPEITTMQAVLAGQSNESLDAVSVGYLASWATAA